MVKRIKGRQVSLPAGIGIGIGASVFISIAGAMILAVLINGEYMDINSLTAGTALLHLIASFVGSWLASVLTKQKRLITSLITAASYLLVMLGMTALVFGGQYQGVGLALLMVLIGAGVVILLGLKGKSGSSRKHKIPAYR